MTHQEKKVLSTEGTNLLRFNIAKVTALSSFGPFEIYSLFYLSSTSEGRIMLGIVMISALILGICFDPIIGRIIDYHHRKPVLNFIIVSWAASLVIAFSIWTSNPGSKEFIIPLLFVFLDFSGGAFFSTLRSFQQTITGKKLYGRSNALSEISGQLPSFIGAGAAIPIIMYVGVRYSLLISTLVLIIPLLLLGRIRENFEPVASRDNGGKIEGTLSFLKSHYRLVIFFYLLNFTFIVVAVGNLLKPVFIVDVLNGNTSSISLSEMTYSVLGSITGLILSVIPVKFGLKYCYLFMTLFAFGSFLIPFSPDITLFLIFQSTHGVGNPGNRISRNTIVMNNVKTSDSGRFFAAISFLSNISRLILLSLFTLLVNITGPGLLIELTGFMMVGAIGISSLIYLRAVDVRRALSSDNSATHALSA